MKMQDGNKRGKRYPGPSCSEMDEAKVDKILLHPLDRHSSHEHITQFLELKFNRVIFNRTLLTVVSKR